MDSKPASDQEASSALEQFRKQWQDDINTRNKQHDRKPERPPQARRLTAESSARPEKPINKPPARHPLADVKDEDDAFDELKSPRSDVIERIEGLRVRDVDEDDFSSASTTEPKSALEHYERAVEKESQGSLGDSLTHYRRAYRLDATVDQIYKKKHFSAKPKPKDPGPSNVAATAPNTAPQPSEGTGNKTFAELISSFSGVQIPNAEPIIEGDILPPCPIRKLPTEVLMDVLERVAVRDPAILARFALVCKCLAYHIYIEDKLWRRIALGQEFGLGSQQYKFVTDVQGREAIFRTLEEEDGAEEAELPAVDEALFPKVTDWREVFHSHPRIRFTGVYISTVNYSRAGGASALPGAWHSSVHIVTYYRYLRFFRDGTLISLLTTNEPVEVVHHLTKENVHLSRSRGKDAQNSMTTTAAASREVPTLAPSIQNTLSHALKGRWRLCHPSLDETTAGSAIGANMGLAGDLHIETEGVGSRYTYTMHLSVRSGSKSKNAVKNNKLMWKGFWSYNHLTDDWSEFQLRNDKVFWFSRVKSYGLGY